MIHHSSSLTASALAHPNIAFIKYWGNIDDSLRLPVSGSISMNLDALSTRTTVTFNADFPSDTLTINALPVAGSGLARVSTFLDLVRAQAHTGLKAAVVSENNFPSSAGMASSASAFAALALAAARALGLDLTEAQLSALARRGSGSACRSIPGGFVEWRASRDDSECYAQSIVSPQDWDLVDCIAIVCEQAKTTGSTEGHTLAATSPLQAARINDAPRRLDLCRRAIQEHDFTALAQIVEQDNHIMHAVMMTSTPPLIYWQPETLTIMKKVVKLREGGLPVCYTIDAGPNVHVLCPADAARGVLIELSKISGIRQVLTSHPGGPARIILPDSE
jgi:diphosphomevalonate decarboxylase